MVCTKCNTQNPDGSKFCNTCGAPLTADSPPAQPSVSARTSTMAVIALICGILTPFTCGVTGLAAIVLGIIALVEISKSSGTIKGKGMAIAGCILPFVWLPLLILIFYFSFKVKMTADDILDRTGKETKVSTQNTGEIYLTPENFNRIGCNENLVKLHKALLDYTSKNNGKFPASDKWCDQLIENSRLSKTTFHCPGASKGPSNYAMNVNIEKLGADAPPDMVLLFETIPGWNQSGGRAILRTENHKDEGCNILLNNGTVSFIQTKDLDKLKWKVE